MADSTGSGSTSRGLQKLLGSSIGIRSSSGSILGAKEAGRLVEASIRTRGMLVVWSSSSSSSRVNSSYANV